VLSCLANYITVVSIETTSVKYSNVDINSVSTFDYVKNPMAVLPEVSCV